MGRVVAIIVVLLLVAGGAVVALQMQGIVSLPMLDGVLPDMDRDGEEPAFESRFSCPRAP